MIVTKKINNITITERSDEGFNDALNNHLWDTIDYFFTFTGTYMKTDWNDDDVPVRAIINLADEDEYIEHHIEILFFLDKETDVANFYIFGFNRTYNHFPDDYFTEEMNARVLRQVLLAYIESIKEYIYDY